MFPRAKQFPQNRLSDGSDGTELTLPRIGRRFGPVKVPNPTIAEDSPERATTQNCPVAFLADVQLCHRVIALVPIFHHDPRIIASLVVGIGLCWDIQRLQVQGVEVEPWGT